MNGKKRTYEPRIFEGRVMLPEEQEQIHMQLLTSKRLEVSDSMRKLILEEWPELAHKLAPKADRGLEADMVASSIAELEAEVARLHNAQLQLEAELEDARQNVREAHEALRELEASEDSDSNLLTVANATLRQAEERERETTDALAVATERREAAEIQLAEAKGQD
jgi:septal ring factor EnvC (AmiA/AmiB activator)